MLVFRLSGACERLVSPSLVLAEFASTAGIGGGTTSGTGDDNCSGGFPAAEGCDYVDGTGNERKETREGRKAINRV